ncbi:uncharacterized protein KY384_003418 [Bacidia gigantensis]|uniref:uncharacterized protein n=1 Tax=Bacidia gigantensis TaxID=2732470 RepID=UPI001D048DA2|nr:uncharacterized protein KY384_003418 [Bacidia gigantensis]KAG8531782.1 hypothetical protein KY384_003418 [Bacidia gigantensis]
MDLERQLKRSPAPKHVYDAELYKAFASTQMWTSVQINLSIFYGSLSSLQPIYVFVINKIQVLRSYIRPEQRGSELLKTLLPLSMEIENSLTSMSHQRSMNSLPETIDLENSMVEIEASERPTPEISDGELHEVQVSETAGAELEAFELSNTTSRSIESDGLRRIPAITAQRPSIMELEGHWHMTEMA